MAQRSTSVCAILILACASAPLAPATSPIRGETEERGDATATQPSAPTIRVEFLDGPVPWTHLDAQNDDEEFHFAIVTDRTGGMRRGVFASAIPKLNSLRPELVMSVGDLIEGYTEDEHELLAEWDEFDGLVKKLRAPFFYVPGNHDLTNDKMRELWAKRYGPAYYDFVYKNVLFLCLNSMDGGLHRVGQEQLDWLEQTLTENDHVRWTLVFLHTPLWDDFKGEPERRGYGDEWGRIERVLGDRPYTAFAGHHHSYVKHVRHDRRLFTLATTGGGSWLRGPKYGEFDQVTWVTMGREGPVVANLLLEGILDENVYTEELRAFHRSLARRETLRPSAVYVEHGKLDGQSEVRVTNTRDVPLEIRLKVSAPKGVGVEPKHITLAIPPNATKSATLQVSATAKAPEDLLEIPIEWLALSTEKSGGRFEMKGSTLLPVIRPRSIGKARRPVKVDGVLDEWSTLPIVVDAPAQVLKDAAALRSPEDNRFRVGMSHDSRFLYIAVEVFDDAYQAVKERFPWDQDGVEIRVDARPEPVRSQSHGLGNRDEILLIALSPSESAEEVWLLDAGKALTDVKAACVRTETGFVAEVAVPRSWIAEQAKGKAEMVRINVAVNDGDPDGQSQSWWQPDWRTGEDRPGSGTFRFDR